MKKIILSFLILFTCSLTQAQMPKYIQIVAYWHKGDTMNFSIQKSKKEDKNLFSIQYTVELIVVDSTEQNYRIQANYHRRFIDDDNLIPDSLKPILKNLTSGLDTLETLYYLTNDVGSFLEIEDWENVLNRNIKSAEIILRNAGVTEEDLQKSLDIIKTLYGHYELVENLYPELLYLHKYIGYIVQTSPKKFTNNFNTPFGPIEGKGILSVTDYKPETEYCRLESTTNINQKQLKKMLNQLFQTTASNGGESVSKKELNNMSIDMTDMEIYEYQAYSGIPLGVKYTRTTTAIDANGQYMQEEKLVIKKIK